MKVGLIARAEDRGLGNMTWDFYRHVHPDRTLVVDMGDLARGFAPHLDRYPDGLVVGFDGHRWSDEAAVRDWLAGLDVVYTAETFYDWRTVVWAREAGVATVVHSMPEFYRHNTDPTLRPPTRWWLPTGWRSYQYPEDRTHVVPVPVDLDAAPRHDPRYAGPVRFLHVGGHPAMNDRNGTTIMRRAVSMMREPCEVTMAVQASRMQPVRRRPPGVVVRSQIGSLPDRWDLYRDHDALVLPRRYGGLCLPVQEALASGLAVVMTGCAPNPETWPILPLPADPGPAMKVAPGLMDTRSVNPRVLAVALDSLAARPPALAQLQAMAREWADGHSWDALLPEYLTRLEEATDER